MVSTLTIIYLFYMFFAIYLLNFTLLLFFKNRKKFFHHPAFSEKYNVSFVVPAYNEGETIQETIESILSSDYKKIKEIIVVNDCSADNTIEKVEALMKKYPQIKLINNPKNLGNAARSQNVGLKYVTGDLVAIVDADTIVSKDCISKMIGFFENSKVGAVTCPSRPRNVKNFLQRLQQIEYDLISFMRKLLGYVDGIYVTPGTMAFYRKKALDEIGGFDENNFTQDIEATWHIILKGWERKITLAAYVHTTVPDTLKKWLTQRRRWSVGGLQCLWKYRKHFFSKGMLGYFIIPYFTFTTFSGIIGVGIFLYLLFTKILSTTLFAKYSITAGATLVSTGSFFGTPSFLNYLGITLFFLGIMLTLFILFTMQNTILKKRNVFNFLFFQLVYLAVFPFITITAMFSVITKKTKWR